MAASRAESVAERPARGERNTRRLQPNGQGLRVHHRAKPLLPSGRSPGANPPGVVFFAYVAAADHGRPRATCIVAGSGVGVRVYKAGAVNYRCEEDVMGKKSGTKKATTKAKDLAAKSAADVKGGKHGQEIDVLSRR
jgi:hypothetical protein